MYCGLSIEELRTICRSYIESLEIWARTFIHQILSKEWGVDYIHEKNTDGNYKIKTEIVKRVETMMKAEPSRYTTFVDAMLLDDIIYVLCKKEFYDAYFSSFFTKMYPEGAAELRTFLNRLQPIRNKLSHANPISVREAEQCVCYSNDFIDCIKEYFRMTGQDKDFPSPSIIRVDDSLGNEYLIKEGRGGETLIIIDPQTKEQKVFYLGEKFSLYLTPDPSYAEDSYTLNWTKQDGMEIINKGKQVNVTITNNLIGETVVLSCRLISTEDWHKWKYYDQQLFVHFKALPKQKR